LAGIGAAPVAAGQNAPPVPEARPNRPLVFIDGPGFDAKTLAEELPFVRLVDASGEAQVLVATEEGPDGLRIVFRGRGEFEKNENTLICRSEAGEPAEAFRRRVAQTIKLGLLRYVSKTPAAGRVHVRLLDTVKPTAVIDPWNFWVFSAGVDAFLQGEQSYRSEMWMGNVSASRVTPQWKTSITGAPPTENPLTGSSSTA
jgi:hypothetical protein